MLAQRDVHLIGDDGGLGLCQVAVGVEVACQGPAGEVILSVAHDNFNDGIALAVFVGAWLVLERVGAAKRVAPDTELTVQLSSKRRKAVLGIVAAGERRHAVVGIAAEVVLMTVKNRSGLVAANGARCRCRVTDFTVRLSEADVELVVVVDVPVHTSQQAVGRGLDIVVLPRTRLDAVVGAQIGGQRFQLAELRTATGVGVRIAAITGTG